MSLTGILCLAGYLIFIYVVWKWTTDNRGNDED
jgi:hypothetical protein